MSLLDLPIEEITHELPTQSGIRVALYRTDKCLYRLIYSIYERIFEVTVVHRDPEHDNGVYHYIFPDTLDKDGTEKAIADFEAKKIIDAPLEVQDADYFIADWKSFLTRFLEQWNALRPYRIAKIMQEKTGEAIVGLQESVRDTDGNWKTTIVTLDKPTIE